VALASAFEQIYKLKFALDKCKFWSPPSQHL